MAWRIAAAVVETGLRSCVRIPPSRYSTLRKLYRVDPESALEEAKTCDLYRTAIVCFVCCALVVSDPRKVSEANVLALGGDWERELKFAHELTGKRPVWCQKCRKANSGGKGKRGRPATPFHPVGGVEDATKRESCESVLSPSPHKTDLLREWRPVLAYYDVFHAAKNHVANSFIEDIVEGTSR